MVIPPEVIVVIPRVRNVRRGLTGKPFQEIEERHFKIMILDEESFCFPESSDECIFQ